MQTKVFFACANSDDTTTLAAEPVNPERFSDFRPFKACSATLICGCDANKFNILFSPTLLINQILDIRGFFIVFFVDSLIKKKL